MSGSRKHLDSLELRRARLKFTGMLTQNSKYGIQIDTSGAVSTSNQQVQVREGYITYTGGNGDAARNLSFTAGLFANPFGYKVPESTSVMYSPERPLAFSEGGAGIFATQDYDKGIQFAYNTSQKLLFIPAGLKLSVSVINGTGRTSEESDRYKDQVYRVAYQTPNKVLGLGASFYEGQINTAVPGTIGAASAPIFASSGSLYTGRKKELYGVDGQLQLPAGLFVQGEYVGGVYEQRSYFATPMATGLTTDYAKDNKIDGYYATGGWTFGQTGSHPLTLAAQYDVLRRGEGPKNAFNTGGSDTYTDENVGYGALYNLDKATRLRFWYTHPDKVAHAPGTASPPKYGLFTGEIQVKF